MNFSLHVFNHSLQPTEWLKLRVVNQLSFSRKLYFRTEAPMFQENAQVWTHQRMVAHPTKTPTETLQFFWPEETVGRLWNKHSN